MNFRLKADEILAQQPDNNSPLAAKTNYNYMHGLTEHSYKDVVCGQKKRKNVSDCKIGTTRSCCRT